MGIAWRQFHSTPLASPPTALIIGANANRRALYIVNDSAGGSYVGPNSNVSAINFVDTVNTVRPLILLYRDWGELVCSDWWAFVLGLSGDFNVTEAYYT